LLPAKGGARVTSAKEDDRVMFGIRQLKKPDGTMSQHLVASKTPMTYIALMLTLVVKRPVVDRTALAGDFNLDVEFSSLNATAESFAPSIFTALQEQAGLRLETAKVPVDVIVIDHVEKPSEN